MMKEDKYIEQKRYDKRAEKSLEVDSYNIGNKISLPLDAPYVSYKKQIEYMRSQGFCKTLEIGAGMGENTEFLLQCGFNVCATDISKISVDVMKNRFSGYGMFRSEVADMENLPFDDGSFDMVCSAGSLSYGDNTKVMNEIYRVLRLGGGLIVVDSLNHNPIYKFNRNVHYLRGNRSKSTLNRMPTVGLIERYSDKFGYAEVSYFGAITWLFPTLSWIMSEELIASFSNYLDCALKIKKSAFKFTMRVIKK